MLVGPRSRTIDGEVGALLAAAGSGRPVDQFRAGVALRMRFDGSQVRGTDLQGCIAWFAALMGVPNQYIWRRRIQQWGPPLDKPYAFYDWVAAARAEVQERGERPVTLRVPLSRAERALRSRSVPVPAGGAVEPDPDGRVTKDPGRLVRLEVAVALNTAAVGPRIRILCGALRLRGAAPAARDELAHGRIATLLWLDPGEGWRISSPRVSFDGPGEGESSVPSWQISSSRRP